MRGQLLPGPRAPSTPVRARRVGSVTPGPNSVPSSSVPSGAFTTDPDVLVNVVFVVVNGKAIEF